MSSEPDKSCATWFVVNLGLAVRHFSKCCKSSLIIGCYRLAHVIHSNISYLGPSSTELMLGPIAFHHVCAAFPRSRRLFFTSPRTCSAVLCCVFFFHQPTWAGSIYWLHHYAAQHCMMVLSALHCAPSRTALPLAVHYTVGVEDLLRHKF
jgi:hypothetical protein